MILQQLSIHHLNHVTTFLLQIVSIVQIIRNCLICDSISNINNLAQLVKLFKHGMLTNQPSTYRLVQIFTKDLFLIGFGIHLNLPHFHTSQSSCWLEKSGYTVSYNNYWALHLHLTNKVMLVTETFHEVECSKNELKYIGKLTSLLIMDDGSRKVYGISHLSPSFS